MKGNVALTLGAALIFLGYKIGRRAFSRIDSIESPEQLQLLIFGCLLAGLALVVVGIIGWARR